MGDVSTGLLVQTAAGQFVVTKLSDGTNTAAVSSVGAVSENLTQVGGTAIAIGQAVMTASLPVVIASNQSPVAVGAAAAALGDNTATPTTSILGAALEGFDGTTWDRIRTTDATDGHAASTPTGMLSVGIGPGWTRRFSPSNLATANNSAVTEDVNGAGTTAIEIGTSTTGTFVIEVTVDGTTWIPGVTYDVSGAAFVTNTSLTPTTGKVYLVSTNGMQQVRIRTNATLGATVANVWTLALGDAITFVPGAGATGAVNLTQIGGNSVVTGGVNGSLGVGGLAASGATAAGNPIMVGGVFNTTQPTVTNGQAVDLQATARGALIVGVGVDGFAVTGTVAVTGVATAANQTNVQIVDNAAFTDGTTTLMMSGFIFDEVAGTALTENDAAAARIDAKRALVGVIEDATTRGQRAAVTAAGGLGSNILSVGGTAVVAAGTGQAVPARLTDGTAYYTKTGQALGSAIFNLLTDGTNTAAVLATLLALKTDLSSVAGTATVSGGVAGSQGVGGLAASGATGAGSPVKIGGIFNTTQPTVTNTQAVDLQATARGALIIATGVDVPAMNISQVSGATQSATNPLFVRLTDGAAAYVAGSGAPVSPQFATLTSASLGAGSSANLDGTAITGGKTGRFAGFDFSSSVPCKVIVSTVASGTPTVRIGALFIEPYVAYSYRPPFNTYITQSGGATSFFRLGVTNKDASQAADVFATQFWDEV